MKFRLAPGLSLAVACCLVLTACSSYKVQMGWPPIYKQAKPAPEAVNELNLVNADGTPANYPQYWKRNTLVVDLLTAAGSGGQVMLKPREGGKWPVRIAFRVMPGSIGLLEVQADQRLLMPVTREGAKPIDLELVPSVYTPKTPQITVKWEAMKAPPS